jgi:hypothetical protein
MTPLVIEPLGRVELLAPATPPRKMKGSIFTTEDTEDTEEHREVPLD